MLGSGKGFSFAGNALLGPKMRKGNDEHFVTVPQGSIELEGSDTSSDEVRISSPFDTSKIRIEPKPAILDALIKRIRNDEIDLQPEFQRNSDIWTDVVQSRLIESLILRIPIPAFYFDATNENRWVVVDGLQRLGTVKKFVVDEKLTLVEMEFLTDFNGLQFKELPRNFQRNIEEADISMYLIREGTPPDVKFNLFKRINTGGQPLSPQEIRHALNQGAITKKLEELANSDEFKSATDNGVTPKRMDDRECVMRFFAFMMNDPENYDRDDFDKFLNDAMAKANNMPTAELEQVSGLFLEAMRRARRIFDNDAFRKRYSVDRGRSPINKALFETWAVNLAKVSNDDAGLLFSRRLQLKEKFLKTMNGDNEFDSAITQGTGSKSKVRCRFKVINRVINEVLHAGS